MWYAFSRMERQEKFCRFQVYRTAGLSTIGSEVLISMKKPFVQRFGDFIEGKGFYIVLFLCIAAIGVSGWYLFSSFTPEQEDVAAGGPAQVTVTPTPRVTAPAVTAEHAVPTPTPAATPKVTATPAPAATPTPAATPAAAPTSYFWPVRGDVLTGYSVDALSYDPTMADWRTHTGIDIASAAGTEVRAAAAGTVTSVTSDVMMGTTVVVDHGGGMTTTYANLAATPTVEEGDTVSSGDILGSVGNTAIAESALPDHLHFSMEQDGAPVDPLSYLTK